MFSDVRVLYLCDFDLSKGTGKDRATRQKLGALRDKVSSLEVISNNFKNPFLRLTSIFLLDVRALIYIIFNRPDWFISRGYTGTLSLLAASFLGVLTIREVHANALEEFSLLPYKGIKLFIIKKMAFLAHKNDVAADVRIFNHPDLLDWYRANGFSDDGDFYVYNGFDPNSKCDISRSEARKMFGLREDDKVIVFVGGASKWHGVDYLIDLQKEFIAYNDNIIVAFGGGGISEFDPEGVCLSFSPLNESECAKLIRASDFCALPVKANRVSPGSPLKLYDYIVNERFVFSQANTNGYSDEVQRFRIGVPVDFTDVKHARRKILDAFESDWPEEYPVCAASWGDRMEQWLKGIGGETIH